MVGSVFLTLGLLTLAVMRKPAMAGSILNLADLFIVLVIPIAVLVLIMALMSSRKVDHLKFKCQQCGHHWTMSKEEWRQAGDTSAQTKTLSPQEKEEKKAAVESLINQIKKM